MRDPVSAVDREIEQQARRFLAARFPGATVIGEEGGETRSHDEPDRGLAFVIDPIDGTTNFVRRYPLFASSFGVLRDGVPIAGAIWCSATTACRPGVYHVRRGRVHLDDDPLDGFVRVAGPLRGLVGDVGPPRRRDAPLDHRASGSAAIECALVAAGVLDAARFRRLWIWDVAGGVALARAAEIPVWIGTRHGWSPFERFESPRRSRPGRRPTLRDWHHPLLLGPLEASGREA